PLIWIDGNMGAREWITSASILYLIDYIVFSSDSPAKTLRSKYRFIIVPNLNPDGYSHSMSKDRLWVKNMRELSKLCVGINLNYNFDADYIHSNSNKICSEKYAGTEHFSENETKAVRKVFTSSPVFMSFSVHAYGQMWLIPYACCNNTAPNYNEMARVANIAVNAIKKETNSEFQVGKACDLLHEFRKGSSMDWSKMKHNVSYSYGILLRPKTIGDGGYILPPSQIVLSGRELVAGIINATNNARL
ncbi:hypothetical protein HELRODRAFT_63114, partial [Helobdella robusta]|uniref:Peptidase M14 domain-containing protein n=1 Tax=Helobdella robusta TaxID=6412 RepID=T1FXB1_HELRO